MFSWGDLSWLTQAVLLPQVTCFPVSGPPAFSVTWHHSLWAGGLCEGLTRVPDDVSQATGPLPAARAGQCPDHGAHQPSHSMTRQMGSQVRQERCQLAGGTWQGWCSGLQGTEQPKSTGGGHGDGGHGDGAHGSWQPGVGGEGP